MEYSVATLLDQLPDEFKQSKEARFLASITQRHAYNLVHLIYRPRGSEGDSKDYEFSRLSMTEHWRSGYHDAMRTLRHPEVLERPAMATRSPSSTLPVKPIEPPAVRRSFAARLH